MSKESGARFARLFRLLVVIGTMAAALVVAGCSDDDDGGGSGGSGTVAETTAGDSTQIALDYVGGTAGAADPSAEPIRIGYANGTGAFASAPTLTEVTKATVKYINEELGGIGGRPLELEICGSVANEEQALACGRKLANDDSLVAVMYGQIIVGPDAFRKAVNDSGKPLIGINPNSPNDIAQKNTFFTTGGYLTGGTWITYMRDYVKANNVAQVWPDSPEIKPYIDGFTKQLEGVGMKTTVATIPANASDVVSSLVAAKVTDSDVIAPLVFAPQCVPLAKGLTQLGTGNVPVVTSSTCLEPSVDKALGDFPKWTYYQPFASTTIPDNKGEVEAFRSALAAAYPDKAEDLAAGDGPPVMFGTTLWLAKILNQVGADALTPEAISEAAGAYEGPLFLGQPDLKFGVEQYPAVGGVGMRFYTYLGDGKWEDATDGKWVQPTLQDLGLG